MKPTPRQRLGLLAFGACFLALFAGFAIAEGLGPPAIPSGDVALVEGVPGDSGQIGEAEFEAALAQAVAQGGGKTLPAVGSEAYEEAKATAMERLLKAAWVGGEAAEAGIAVKPAQITAAIASFKEQQHYETAAQFRHFLAASHLSLAEFKALARLQLLSAAVQEHAVAGTPAPSDSEVADYYEAAKGVQFTTTPTYDIRLILNLDRDKVARARAALARDDSPATWKRLAAPYSEDPVAKRQGGLHEAIPAEFGEPLDAAIAAAPVGEPQGLVKAKGVFFVFEVESSTPAEVEPLAKVRSHIVAQLTHQDAQQALESFASEFEAKWRNRTHCAAGFEVEGCEDYRGSGHPPNAPPACYEAHPKAGIAAPACPAPVAQAVPAMPGTVSVLSPGGIALAQRPVPSKSSER
ncbi:MAG TPA: peptidylprolyl isomerase [Solirubrobacterales bacterium]|nr:peptidylprolyl isomerase [Solirubrobacterales bacterium]